MRYIATILQLLLVVSLQTPLGQLLKMPLLVNHYLSHQKLNGVSFVDFLAEHYDNEHHDADKSEDERLPFKNTDGYHSGCAVVPDAVVNNPVPGTFYPQKETLTTPGLKSQSPGSIFHPPRNFSIVVNT